MLVACAARHPDAGPVGPLVAKDWPGARVRSLGERFWATLAWMPRTLLRHRRRRQRPYPVGGVMGCALLVTRRLYGAVGGLDDDYFAYYEEVDYCLRARAAGYRPLVDPRAEIAHAGHRGFGGGLTTVAAYLKSRNLWTLARKHVAAPGLIVFVPGYAAMMLASMIGYLLRGRTDVVRAMAVGVAAGLRGETGPPPDWVFAGPVAGAVESGRAA